MLRQTIGSCWGRWVKNRPKRLLGFGLLSSVVNGCQRSEGLLREDWGHKVGSLRGKKAGKHRVTENTEVKRAESRETQSHREHREKNRAVAVGGMLGSWPIRQRLAMAGFGCYRMKEVPSEENGRNPLEGLVFRRSIRALVHSFAICSQSVDCYRTLCPKSPANHLPIL